MGHIINEGYPHHSQKWSHLCPWKVIAHTFLYFFKYTLLMVGDGTRIQFLGPTIPFCWNLNSHHTLLDIEIEDLERFMSFLSYLLLSPFGFDSRAQSLSSASLSVMKLFFHRSNHIDPTSFFIDFILEIASLI